MRKRSFWLTALRTLLVGCAEKPEWATPSSSTADQFRYATVAMSERQLRVSIEPRTASAGVGDSAPAIKHAFQARDVQLTAEPDLNAKKSTPDVPCLHARLDVGRG
jgi:hypothetical protein